MKKAGLLVAAVGAALVGMFAFGGKANAQSGVPTGWTPPSGAVFTTSTSNPTGLTLNSWKWRDSGGLGNVVLVTNAKNPTTDFVAFFVADKGGTPSILQQGTTQNSGLIAQAGAAGILA
jgi:hypothetical protein